MRFGNISSVWDNSIVRERLAHYWNILQGKELPYYLLCKRIGYPMKEDRFKLDVHMYEVLKQEFEEIMANPRRHQALMQNPEEERLSFLHLKYLHAVKMHYKCEFCENLCRVDRSGAKKGKCGIGSYAHVSSSFLHTGEEAPLVPSGTIFFSGCNFNCVFCQNADISNFGKQSLVPSFGMDTTPELLAKKADSLAESGALNINYVGGDPIPNLHIILQSMLYQTHKVAQLWNSNFYNSFFSLELLADLIDIWLPDFKYGNNICAEKYSGIKNYVEILQRNLVYIYTFGSKSIIIRHLVLPGHVDCCSIPILQWIHDNIPHVLVNIMAQYHPDHLVSDSIYPELNRYPTSAEMERVYHFADGLNIEYRAVS